MNKIICDKCKTQIKPLIESKHLTGGIRIQYFRCNSCRVKVLIDVTDAETRRKQIEYNKWAEQKKKALDIVIDDMEENKLAELVMLVDEITVNMEQILKEIKEAKAELKVKYEGEL